MTAVDDWLTYLSTSRGLSENTVRTYASTMRTLPGDPLTLTREDMEEWWSQRASTPEGGARPHSSRNAELSAVRSFYKWAGRFDRRTDNPTARLDLLRKPRRESRFVGQSDLDRLMRDLPEDLRRAVALGAYAGIRVSEAAALDWRDVDQESRRIIVRGKGDHERRVGLSITLLDVILPRTGGNVVRAGGPPFSGHTLQMKVNAAIRAAGVDATFHKLRHRYGYKAAEDGAAATSIARAMGHASLQTTMGYIAAVDTDLDRIAEAAARR